MKLEVLVEVRKMWVKIHDMSDVELQTIWQNLVDSGNYDPEKEYAPGVPMHKYITAVFSEMTKRHLAAESE